MAGRSLRDQTMDIIQLIEALERQSKEIAAAIRSLNRRRGNIFIARFALLDRIGQFETLLALIEGRLDRLSEDKRALLLDRIHDLNLYVIRETLRSTLTYCRRLSKRVGTPLWGRVILQRDLNMLLRMERQLGHESLARQASEDDLLLLRQAVDAVTALIDAAPAMPDFEGEPDLMPPRLPEPRRRDPVLAAPKPNPAKPEQPAAGSGEAG